MFGHYKLEEDGTYEHWSSCYYINKCPSIIVHQTPHVQPDPGIQLLSSRQNIPCQLQQLKSLIKGTPYTINLFNRTCTILELSNFFIFCFTH